MKFSPQNTLPTGFKMTVTIIFQQLREDMGFVIKRSAFLVCYFETDIACVTSDVLYTKILLCALQIPKTMVKGFIGYINNPNTVFQFSNS